MSFAVDGMTERTDNGFGFVQQIKAFEAEFDLGFAGAPKRVRGEGTPEERQKSQTVRKNFRVK